MANSYTPNYFLAEPAQGDQNWHIPLNSDFSILDSALGNFSSIVVPGSGSAATLTPAQYQSLTLDFSGAPANDFTYTIPIGVLNSSAGIINGGRWFIRNTTTTGKNIIIAYRAGAVTIPAGTMQLIVADSNVYPYIYPLSDSSVNTFAGNPNGNVAGNAGAPVNSTPASVIWDSTNSNLWICTQSGPASTAIWKGIVSNVANNFTANQTISGAATGSSLTLTNTAANGTGGDSVFLSMNENNSSGTLKGFARLELQIASPTAGSEYGSIVFSTMKAGALSQSVTIRSGYFSANAVGSDQGIDSVNAKTFFKDGVALGLTQFGAIATTSGATVAQASIVSPKRVIINFQQVSTTGTAGLGMRLGTVGGIQSINYDASAAALGTSSGAQTTYIPLTINFAAAHLCSGIIVLEQMGPGGTTWTVSGTIHQSGGTFVTSIGGFCFLSAALTQLLVFSLNGAETFDGGSISVTYES